VTATSADGTPTATTDCACTAGGGGAIGMRARTNPPPIHAESAAGTVLGAAPPLAADTIDVQNRVTDWGTLQIAIDGL
jgi:hypothetical protein